MASRCNRCAIAAPIQRRAWLVKLEEICAYEVKDGKVVSERFFM